MKYTHFLCNLKVRICTCTLPSESLNAYVLCHFEIDGNLMANREVCLNSELCDNLSLVQSQAK